MRSAEQDWNCNSLQSCTVFYDQSSKNSWTFLCFLFVRLHVYSYYLYVFQVDWGSVENTVAGKFISQSSLCTDLTY
jgi:hypothetical protein